MAIGNADFTAKQKRGMAWKFGVEPTWELIEPLLIEYLKELGKEWNKQRSLSTAEFNDGLMAIVDKLKDDPETLQSVKTVLGL